MASMVARIGGGMSSSSSWSSPSEEGGEELMLRLPTTTYDQTTPSLCASEKAWSGLSGLPAWHELVRGFEIVHEVRKRGQFS